VQWCGTRRAWLRGGEEIKKVCERPHSTTTRFMFPRWRFFVEEVECLGACVNAPMVLIAATLMRI